MFNNKQDLYVYPVFFPLRESQGDWWGMLFGWFFPLNMLDNTKYQGR